MHLPSVITIDGPAAAGKSTLGFLLAQHLGYAYFDTGVLYRAVTFLALDGAVALDNQHALADLAHRADLEVLPPTVADGRQYTVVANGVDITAFLRDVAVERNVSTVAAYPMVRAALRHQQRRIGSRGGVVMVGRDIGSVVMPDAELKIYLKASLRARATRRHADVVQRGDQLQHGTVEADLARRDALDAPNTFRPDNAWVLDTDLLTPEQEVDAILHIIETGQWSRTAAARP